MSRYRHILDIPGEEDDLDTEGGRFLSELEQLVVFKPGIHPICTGPIASVIDLTNTRDTNITWVELVSTATLDALEQLLQRTGLTYFKNPQNYRLCCDAATKESRALLFSNWYNEGVLLIASPRQLYHVEATAFIPEFTQEDERFEIAYIRDQIANGNTSYKIFNSEEEARQYMQENLERLFQKHRQPFMGDGPNADAVIISDFNTKDVHTFPEGIKVSDEMVVHKVSMSLPYIARTYSDGKVLVTDQSFISPFFKYFKPEEGIEQYDYQCVCDACEANLVDKIRPEAKLEMWESYAYADLRAILEREGYEIDPNRITLNVKKRKPIEIDLVRVRRYQAEE